MKYHLLILSFILSLGSVFLLVAKSGEVVVLGFPIKFIVFYHLDLYHSPLSALNPLNFLSMNFNLLLCMVNAGVYYVGLLVVVHLYQKFNHRVPKSR